MGKLSIITAAICMGLATAGTATAAEWQTWTPENSRNAQTIYTSDDMSPGVLLSCTSAGKLAVVIDLEGGDVIANASRHTVRRARYPSITLKLGERPSLTEDWAYIPTRNQIQPRKRSTIAKVYNAMIRGEIANIEMRGKDAINLVFPPMNDAFRAFAATCSATQPKP